MGSGGAYGRHMDRHGMPVGQFVVSAILTTLERVWAQKLSVRGACRGRRDRAPDKFATTPASSQIRFRGNHTTGAAPARCLLACSGPRPLRLTCRRCPPCVTPENADLPDGGRRLCLRWAGSARHAVGMQIWRRPPAARQQAPPDACSRGSTAPGRFRSLSWSCHKFGSCRTPMWQLWRPRSSGIRAARDTLAVARPPGTPQAEIFAI